MKRFPFAIVTLFLLITLLVTGCRPEASPAPPVPPPAPQPAPAPAPTPVPAPPPSGELNLYGIDPITLDPATVGEMTSAPYVLQIFGGLLRLDDNLNPVGDIAESWQVSNGGKTYTFKLRQDVKFHNGRQVKAADFKYSWERAANPATRSLTAGTYLGDIVGVKEVLEGKAQQISGVRVVDDFTLEVTIDAPKSYFLSKMTYPTSFVVDKDNVASGRNWWQKPSGTGPFKLKTWEKEKLLVLERNASYYGDKARVNAVNFQLWGGAPMQMYETGEIDVTDVSLAYIYKVSDKLGQFYDELEAVPELSFGYIGFNATRPPFDDANLRRAFSLAIDKDKIVSLVFKDTVQRADGVLPPGIPGFNKDLIGLKFDVNEAKRLIAASKYGSVDALPPITITVSGYGGLIPQNVEAAVQEWRQNLGVEVTVRQLEPQVFLYNLKSEKDEMYSIGWVADYPHPQNFLDVLFHTGLDNNYGEYSSPEFDAIIDRANVEQDYAASLKLYQQAEQKLVNDAGVLSLYFGRNFVLVKPYVEGYKLNPMGFAWLNKVSVKPH